MSHLLDEYFYMIGSAMHLTPRGFDSIVNKTEDIDYELITPKQISMDTGLQFEDDRIFPELPEDISDDNQIDDDFDGSYDDFNEDDFCEECGENLDDCECE